jgi:hypothetical protein
MAARALAQGAVIEVPAHSGAVVQHFMRAREAGAGVLVQLACPLEAKKGQLHSGALAEDDAAAAASTAQAEASLSSARTWESTVAALQAALASSQAENGALRSVAVDAGAQLATAMESIIRLSQTVEQHAVTLARMQTALCDGRRDLCGANNRADVAEMDREAAEKDRDAAEEHCRTQLGAARSQAIDIAQQMQREMYDRIAVSELAGKIALAMRTAQLGGERAADKARMLAALKHEQQLQAALQMVEQLSAKQTETSQMVCSHILLSSPKHSRPERKPQNLYILY